MNNIINFIIANVELNFARRQPMDLGLLGIYIIVVVGIIILIKVVLDIFDVIDQRSKNHSNLKGGRNDESNY